ncbi:hypothetical protein TGRH88_052290 [Toxoplasma gondii]|uniref:Uncharacterized protein n=1 Tax=Toxoplasma gondii TaxID=5811 RepID=A0A7J6JX75_TOXGO|nr:hypothetical protein TGRH88_052290 [Toxoplasma gondii]
MVKNNLQALEETLRRENDGPSSSVILRLTATFQRKGGICPARESGENHLHSLSEAQHPTVDEAVEEEHQAERQAAA